MFCRVFSPFYSKCDKRCWSTLFATWIGPPDLNTMHLDALRVLVNHVRFLFLLLLFWGFGDWREVTRLCGQGRREAGAVKACLDYYIILIINQETRFPGSWFRDIHRNNEMPRISAGNQADSASW